MDQSQSITKVGYLNGFLNKHYSVSISLCIHMLLLYFISTVTITSHPERNQGDQVRLSVNNVYKLNMQEKVKNLARIEQELKNTLSESAKTNLNLEPIDEIVTASETSSPSQLLELARKISENIRKIERELRAMDLERAVTMSHMDALKTVMSLELAIPEYNANKMPGSEMVKSVERFEESAKNSLRNRLKDMEARGFGEPLSMNMTADMRSSSVKVGKENLKDRLTTGTSFVNEATHSKNDYVDLWLDHIPPVNQQNPRKIAGRIIKEGGSNADRVFIDSWYIIGPFALSADKPPPDYAVDLNGVYFGKDNQTLRWEYLSGSSYPLTPPQIDKTGIFFGYTEVILDREQDLWVWVGADDFASLYLNGNAVWESNTFNKKFNSLVSDKNNVEHANWNLTEYKRLVHFKAGRNTFKMKLTNYDSRAFFSLVLTKT